MKRDREEAKRAGVKPPRHPLIPPIALRPPSLAEQMVDDYVTEIQKYKLPEREERDPVDTIMSLFGTPVRVTP